MGIGCSDNPTSVRGILFPVTGLHLNTSSNLFNEIYFYNKVVVKRHTYLSNSNCRRRTGSNQEKNPKSFVGQDEKAHGTWKGIVLSVETTK